MAKCEQTACNHKKTKRVGIYPHATEAATYQSLCSAFACFGCGVSKFLLSGKAPEKPKLRLNSEIPTSAGVSIPCAFLFACHQRGSSAEKITRIRHSTARQSRSSNYHLDTNATRTFPSLWACDNHDVDWTAVAAAKLLSSTFHPISRCSGKSCIPELTDIKEYLSGRSAYPAMKSLL